MNATETHRHVCTCGDYYVCTRRDCLPQTYEQCPACQQREQDELDQLRQLTRTSQEPNLS